MQNEIIEKDDILTDVLKTYAISMAKDDLKSLLSKMKVASLKQLAQNFEVSNRSKMKKDELVDAVFSNMIKSKEIIKRTLLVVEDDEYELLIDLANGQSEEISEIDIMLYSHLVDNALFFVVKDKKSYKAVMAEEIRELISKVSTKSLKKERDFYQQINKFLQSAVNLYGIISIEKLFEIYNHYFESIEFDEFNCILTEFLSLDRYFIKDGNLIINEIVIERDIKDHILKNKEKVQKYYLPSKETFLNYEDCIYYEKTPQLYTLQAYLKTILNIDEEELDLLIDEIYDLVSTESTLEDIFNYFEEAGIEFETKEQVEKVSELLGEVAINTRLWTNNGFTTKEIYSELETGSFDIDSQINNTKNIQKDNKEKTLNIKHYTSPIRVMKIGRNEPCPCGSGKKYKKCCLGK